jgi:predicted transcriptional regulator
MKEVLELPDGQKIILDINTSTSHLTNGEIEQLMQIGKQQPVFAGNLVSKVDKACLVHKGLVMYYKNDDSDNHGGYVLTDKGMDIYKSIIQLP